MPDTRSPSLAATIQAAVRAGLLDCHTAIPGRIVKYDHTTQKADVKPLVKRAYLDEEGARKVAAIPVICGVPVMFPGAGGYRVTFPVTAGDTDGDTCLLVFSEASIDRWLSGTGAEVDPEIDSDHSLADAVCVLGLKPFGAPLSAAGDSVCTIGLDSGTFVPAALGDTIKSHFDNLKAYIDGHTHSVAYDRPTGPSAPATATAAAPATGSPSVPVVKSDTVKVSR